MEAGSDWVGECWEELKCIRQAVGFLVIGNKPRKSLEYITKDICPVLSIQQLYRISTMFWDNKYNTKTASSEVLGRMKQLMEEQSSSNPYSHNFLLESSSCFKPLVVNNILAQMDGRNM
uniref:Dilute domain-containing protein n=1 Tax=Tetradesmus obliquus TaxID=3088 RepID=A0A383WK54_TETOB|eukprot:jgi/Sobl393_1/11796/SZX70357.1